MENNLDKNSNKYSTLAKFLTSAALIVLISLCAARTMLNEPTFTRGPVVETGMSGAMAVADQIYTPFLVLRVFAPLVILGCACLWALGGLLARNLEIRRPALGILMLLCAVSLFTSAVFNASDKRMAIVTALEQSSLLLGCWLMVQLCSRAAARRLVLVTIVAIAAVQGAKALHQIYVEIPEQVKYFNENRQSQLQSLGIRSGSPEEEMLEARIVEPTAKGFFSLANIYGSMMVLLAVSSFGIALEKLRSWREGVKSGDIKLARGEIHPALAAGTLCMIVSAMAIYGCVATQSIGAFACLIFAFGLAVCAILANKLIEKSRRKLIIAGSILVILMIAAVILVGISRGGLPSRTLQVRWEYWTGSVKLLAQKPLLGVGPGNFDDEYLAVRSAGAEESVKNPHNIIAQALAEYGILGSVCFLGCFVWILLGMCGRYQENAFDCTDNRKFVYISAAAVAGATLGYKLLSSYWPGAAALIVENFIPIFIFPAAVLIGLWSTTQNSQKKRSLSAIFIACGAGGFALHNLSDFAAFRPGSAMLFYIATGMLLSAAELKIFKPNRQVSFAIFIASITAFSLSYAFVYRPVRKAERISFDAATQMTASNNNPRSHMDTVLNQRANAIKLLATACDTDPLDAAIPCDVASLAKQFAELPMVGNRSEKFNQMAQKYIAIAAIRDPQNAKIARENLHISIKDISADAEDFLSIADEVMFMDSEKVNTTRLSSQMLNNLAASEAVYNNNLDRAIKLLQQSIKTDGVKHPVLLSNLADMFWLKGEADKAQKLWREFYGKVNSQLDTKNLEPIKEMFADLAQRDPHYNWHRMKLAQYAWRLGLVNISKSNAIAAREANDALWSGSVLRFSSFREKMLQLTLARIAATDATGP